MGTGMFGAPATWKAKTTSVDRRMLAVPPPAMKNGVTRADVVGNCTRTFVVKNTARPSVTLNDAPGRIAVIVLTAAPVDDDSAEIDVDELGNDPLRRGTLVASISMPIIFVN